jgi:hypothetical protein
MASPTGTTAARLKIVLQRGQALALSEISVRMNAEAPAQLATIGSLKRPTARRGDILFRVGPQNADSDLHEVNPELLVFARKRESAAT